MEFKLKIIIRKMFQNFVILVYCSSIPISIYLCKLLESEKKMTWRYLLIKYLKPVYMIKSPSKCFCVVLNFFIKTLLWVNKKSAHQFASVVTKNVCKWTVTCLPVFNDQKITIFMYCISMCSWIRFKNWLPIQNSLRELIVF